MTPSDRDRLLEAARARGWLVTRTGKGHWILTHPQSGKTLQADKSCKGLAAELRRAEYQAEQVSSRSEP